MVQAKAKTASAASNGNRPLTYDHLRSSKKPIGAKVKIYTEDEPVQRLNEAKYNLDEYLASGLSDADTEVSLRAELEAAVTDLKDNYTKVMLFQSVGRRRYEECVRECPPTDNPEDPKDPETDMGEYRRARAENPDLEPPPYNAEALAPLLIAESSVEPKMTVEQVQQLLDEWTPSEVLEVWTNVLVINTQRRMVAEVGKG